MSRAKCIMVQGTMSGAGKSLLCTAPENQQLLKTLQEVLA